MRNESGVKNITDNILKERSQIKNFNGGTQPGTLSLPGHGAKHHTGRRALMSVHKNTTETRHHSVKDLQMKTELCR